MRGYISFQWALVCHNRLYDCQNRLRDAVARQGVAFPDRLGATLLVWPYGTDGEMERAAASLTGIEIPTLAFSPLQCLPNETRPAEVGFTIEEAESLQIEIYTHLEVILDPDPPKPPFVRLCRIAPPSRKVGAALRGSGLLGMKGPEFVATGLEFWTQTPEGFALRHIVEIGSQP